MSMQQLRDRMIQYLTITVPLAGLIRFHPWHGLLCVVGWRSFHWRLDL